MEEKKKEIKNWIKQHKKELIIAGISLATLIVTVVTIKNYKELEKLFASLMKTVAKTSKTVAASGDVKNIATNIGMAGTDANEVLEKTANNVVPICRAPYDVSGHIRNLHEGCKASAKKLAEAAEEGITLETGQTFVSSYKTGTRVA